MEYPKKQTAPLSHPSAASARPIVQQNGIAGSTTDPSVQEDPAAEQAAARSRERMVSFSPLRAHETDGQRRTRVEAVIDRMIAIPPSRDDPDGSYTGRPIIEGEKPVQDVDDL